VSIIVPMLDELGYIERCIDTLDAQTYPHELLDVIVVDGGSTDGSRELVEKLAASRSWLRVVDNAKRRASAAFNRGIEASKGGVICLVAAHGEVGPDFVERSVAALEETGAAGVGGVLRHEGLDPASVAIGLAMTSPFGMASPFRYATERRYVDTIGHPAYRREPLLAVGPFDESLERNSDYELNYRMRRAGHQLLFDPNIVTVYRPRTSLERLARQFYWYGKGKSAVVRSHPGSLQPRHLVPPAAVLAVISAPLAARHRRGRFAIATGVTAYAGMLAAAARKAAPAEHHADLKTFLVALPVMHMSWGAGFLTAWLRGKR
jgi:glycosyltransferase involved in cell wall biosynthesis